LSNKQNVALQPNTSTKNGPKTKRRWWLYAVLLVILLLVGLAIGGYFTFTKVKGKVESGVSRLQTATNQLKGDNLTLSAATLDNLQQQLAEAEGDFKQAQQDLGLYGGLLPLVGWLPGIGYDAANLTSFLEIAQQSLQAGQLTLQAARPAMTVFEQTNSGAAGGKFLAVGEALATPQAQANFGKAADLLAQVESKRSGIDRAKLNLEQTRKAIDQLDQQLPTLKDGLQLARELPALLPGILGKEHPVNYLAMIQNADELRPTGGFISSVGRLTFDKGKLSLSSFQDSYAVDNPKIEPGPPPEALTQYMQARYFLLRDANWWPDFPTSARQVAALYQQNQNQPVDGVFSIDSQAVAYIFEALGPLDLTAYGEVLTAQNFEERLRYYYLPPGAEKTDDWWLKRKEFTGIVLSGLLNRLNSGGAKDYLRLASWLGRAMQEKHLQIYFNQPDLEAQLTRRGMDGAQLDPQSDYLMTVDTNVGFNKVNFNVDKSLQYRVSSGGSGGTLFASLTMTYTNRAGVREGTAAGECVKVAKYDSDYLSMTNGCYWNYLRVYVPVGSQLRQSSGFSAENQPVTFSENNKTVFAGQLIVPPGQSLTLTFDYTLPNRLSNLADYKLTAQKQAGTRAFPLSVDFTFPGLSQNWAVQLTADQHFAIKS